MLLNHNPCLQSVLGGRKVPPKFLGEFGSALCAKTLIGVSSRSTVIVWERPSNLTPHFWDFWRVRAAYDELGLSKKDEKEQGEGWIRAWRLGMGNGIVGVSAGTVGDRRFKKWRTSIDPTRPRVWGTFDNVLSLSVPPPPKPEPGTVCMGAAPVPDEVAGNKHGFGADRIHLSWI